MEGDHDGDGKLSFEEFANMVSNTVSLLSFLKEQRSSFAQDIVKQMTLEDLF